jgi:hypothetical protein
VRPGIAGDPVHPMNKGMFARLVLSVLAAGFCLAAAPTAFACGSAGYSYAGIASRAPRTGVAA